MSHERIRDLLSQYLDGELDPATRRDVDRHLADCADCAATLAQLAAVKERAGSLSAAPPGADLWPGIAARIGGDRGGSPAIRPVRRVGARPRGDGFRLSGAQLLAAGLAVALVSAGVMWLALRRPGPGVRQTSIPAGRGARPESVGAAGLEGRDAAEDLNRLRRILAESRDRLDPRTVRTLEENLQIIEIAIAQSRRALEADPGDPYIRGHLTETMQRKVDLMRRAAVLASAP
jgi:hypothetical protein